MVIVDDHLAVLAIAGAAPTGLPDGPVATTYAFHFRLVRAVIDEIADGALSRRLADPTKALDRVLRPPADRLLVLDPRVSTGEAGRVGASHHANLLLAELVAAARHHGAAVRVSEGNVGRTWAAVMTAESVDFAAISLS